MDAAGLAILFGAIGAAGTVVQLIILSLRGVFSLEKRVSTLETRMEPFSEGLNALVVDALRKITPSGNPITPERYQYLLGRMNPNALTHQEAQELNDALLELKEKADRDRDLATILAIGLGLLLLAAILKSK